LLLPAPSKIELNNNNVSHEELSPIERSLIQLPEVGGDRQRNKKDQLSTSKTKTTLTSMRGSMIDETKRDPFKKSFLVPVFEGATVITR
jgi:hypothetical protein